MSVESPDQAYQHLPAHSLVPVNVSQELHHGPQEWPLVSGLL